MAEASVATATAETTPPPSTELPTVALVMKTLTNPFFVEMEVGARQAEEELGVDLIVRTGAQETSIEQQIGIIHDLTDAQVDAIVIAPADSRELVPALSEARSAGIEIVNVDNPLDADVATQMGLGMVPVVTVDNEAGAYLCAKYLADQIEEPSQAVILEGIRTAQNAQDRKNGAMRAFDENPNISIVAIESANWKIDEAYSVFELIVRKYPNVRLVFAANDMMALGVIRYLQEQNRRDVLVGGYDALEEAKSAIDTGWLACTVDQQAALQGYTAVRLAVDLVRGAPVPAQTVVGVALVTQAEQK